MFHRKISTIEYMRKWRATTEEKSKKNKKIQENALIENKKSFH